MLDSLLPTSRPPAPVEGTGGAYGVVLDRLLAAVIDIVICIVFVEMPLVYAISVVFPAEYAALGVDVVVLSLVALLPIYSTYGFAFEWLFARTPGKVNRGLVVVNRTGSSPTAIECAIRNLLRYVDILGVPPLVLGTVLPLLTDGRRLGDLLAGTRVVRAGPPPADPLVDPDRP